MDSRTPTKTFAPNYLVGEALSYGFDYDGVLAARRGYAHDVWRRYGIVRYSADGPTFLGLALACDVDVPAGVNVVITGDLASFSIFPYADVRRGTGISQTAIDFRYTYQLGNTPVVALFPRLGFYNSAGEIMADDPIGATPGVQDPLADGVIFLAYELIDGALNGYDDPTTLSHEMVHLLTDVPHTGGSLANAAWYNVLNVFSHRGETRPVWNGQPGSAAAVSEQSWRTDLLTLVSVAYLGSEYDPCAMSGASPWLF
jgi:hypothetical protein